MNRELLLAHFDRISDAPDAIPRLRRFVLDLAVRGKLVEQDPKDEPASELLKRIRSKKALLEKQGKISSPTPLPAIPDDVLPFTLPSGWLWVRFGELVEAADAGWSPKAKTFPGQATIGAS